MKAIYYSLLASFVLLLSGCGMTPNVDLPNTFWQTPHQKIAVANSNPIVPSMVQTGQEGLADIVVNNVVNDKFQGHIKKADMSWYYPKLQQRFVERLRKNSMQAIPVNRALDEEHLPSNSGDGKSVTRKDYRGYSSEVGADSMLVLTANTYGAVRSFYGFIPLGKPQALCSITGKLIDLKSNAILWQHTSTITTEITDPWDGPNYPNFDKALVSAVSLAVSELETSFFTR